MYEWINERMNKCIWMSKWTNEWMNKWINKRVPKRNFWAFLAQLQQFSYHIQYTDTTSTKIIIFIKIRLDSKSFNLSLQTDWTKVIS